jgi:hypothetical protein
MEKFSLLRNVMMALKEDAIRTVQRQMSYSIAQKELQPKHQSVPV